MSKIATCQGCQQGNHSEHAFVHEGQVCICQGGCDGSNCLCGGNSARFPDSERPCSCYSDRNPRCKCTVNPGGQDGVYVAHDCPVHSGQAEEDWENEGGSFAESNQRLIDDGIVEF